MYELILIKKLSEIRNITPDTDADEEIIEQVKANLDTKRQFLEHCLNYEKWNKYNPDLKGEQFNLEIDSEKELKNLKLNIINEMKGD